MAIKHTTTIGNYFKWNCAQMQGNERKRWRWIFEGTLASLSWKSASVALSCAHKKFTDFTKARLYPFPYKVFHNLFPGFKSRHMGTVKLRERGSFRLQRWYFKEVHKWALALWLATCFYAWQDFIKNFRQSWEKIPLFSISAPAHLENNSSHTRAVTNCKYYCQWQFVMFHVSVRWISC